MKVTETIGGIASFLFFLGIVTIVLTFVQPMDPKIDKMFRIGAGITMGVCLLLIIGLGSISQKRQKREPSEEPQTSEEE